MSIKVSANWNIALLGRTFSDTMWNKRWSRQVKSWVKSWELFVKRMLVWGVYDQIKFISFVCGKKICMISSILRQLFLKCYWIVIISVRGKIYFIKIKKLSIAKFSKLKNFTASKSRNNILTLLKPCEIKGFAVNRSKSLVVNNFRETASPWTSA